MMKFKQMEKNEDDMLFTHEITRVRPAIGDIIQESEVTEFLDIFVLEEETDGKKFTCNMCGNTVPVSVCLHFLKDEEINSRFDTVEEEIILCPECTRKLASLFDEVT